MADRGDPRAATSLDALRTLALGCDACALAPTRTTVVFGVGDPRARLLFVGEGPGEAEDLSGEPFVGRAGRLLTSLIEGIGLTRDDVYIANVVKCRPPGNRDPRPEEIAACSPFLETQLDLIAPRVVVTLGNFATQLLLGTREGITRLRGILKACTDHGNKVTPHMFPHIHSQVLGALGYTDAPIEWGIPGTGVHHARRSTTNRNNRPHQSHGKRETRQKKSSLIDN